MIYHYFFSFLPIFISSITHIRVPIYLSPKKGVSFLLIPFFI